ncbi:MAG: hypothetical protein EOP59_09460 [Sphingomonadales bacterium]|nr:MAG: hypothetical protein EOP59_09460 [Sphingomonadales bacterium]
MRALLFAGAMLAALPAAGQTLDRDLIEAMTGQWMILPADGRPGCVIDLGQVSIGPGTAATPSAACKLMIPPLAKVAGWTMQDGDTLLIDAKGAVQMRFMEDETTLLRSPDLKAPRYYMIRRIAGYDHVPPATELKRVWRIAQNGKRPCQITLGPIAPARGGVSGAVTASAACGAGSVPAKLTRWSRDDLNLLLSGPNDVLLVFSPAGKASYRATDGKWTLTR